MAGDVMDHNLKLPWRSVDHSWEEISICDATGEPVALLEISDLVEEGTQDIFEAQLNERAAFIVLAVNCHADLVDVLSDLLQASGDGPRRDAASAKARSILAKARGETP